MVQSGYVNGLPLHLLDSARDINYDPDASCIFVVEWERFKCTNSRDIQKIFRKRHILIVNAPVEAVDFNREGLETLGSLHSPRTVQGLKGYFCCHCDIWLIYFISSS
jgi:hypothetical protein